MPSRPCLNCGHLVAKGQRCITCQPEARPYNAAEYRRNKALLMSGSPDCQLRILCDGAPATTADHTIAVSRGGTHALDNLVPACKACNSSRGSDPGEGPL